MLLEGYNTHGRLRLMNRAMGMARWRHRARSEPLPEVNRSNGSIRPAALQGRGHVPFDALLGLAVGQDRNDIAEGALDAGLRVRPDIDDIAAFGGQRALDSRNDVIRVRDLLAVHAESLRDGDKIRGLGQIHPWVLDTPQLHALAVRVQTMVVVDNDNDLDLLFSEGRELLGIVVEAAVTVIKNHRPIRGRKLRSGGNRQAGAE